MPKPRTVDSVMMAPGHNGIMRTCVTMTECAVSTITLPEGSFACIVASVPDPSRAASIQILDRDDVEAHITFLRNAIEDAERIDAGLPPLHASHSLGRN